MASTPLFTAPTTSERERQVLALLKSLETGDPSPVALINPGAYTQHNLAIGDGMDGLAAALELLNGTARVRSVRVFEDGDYVFVHTDYDFFGPKVGFDIFRFEDGRAVEHWDNLQEPAGPTPSGHTMLDGPTTPTDLGKTEENKALVRTFFEEVLIGKRFDLLPSYFDGDHYIQHNPAIADGLSGLSAALQTWQEEGFEFSYDTVHAVFGEGNFVLVVSEGRFGDDPVAFYDLLRVEDGKIAEHWDTIEAIPPREAWQNDNGKFGF
ncbi:MAG: nuclear transport factor 2 family protein [Bacteroidota bacterium]